MVFLRLTTLTFYSWASGQKMMRKEPEMALSITAVQCGVCALSCAFWVLADGVDLGEVNLFKLFSEEGMRTTAAAVVFTGAVTTAMNRYVETTALGRMKSSEASVILATEPIWAAVFGSLWVSETFGLEDWVGGGLIVLACLANTLKPEQLQFFTQSEE